MSEQKALVVAAGVRITGLLRRHSMETPRAGVILGCLAEVAVGHPMVRSDDEGPALLQ